MDTTIKTGDKVTTKSGKTYQVAYVYPEHQRGPLVVAVQVKEDGSQFGPMRYIQIASLR